MPEDRVVLVTGSAKRIGACIAENFHDQGFNVIIHAFRSLTEAKNLADQLNTERPDSTKVLSANLSVSDEVETLAEQALQCFGRLDVLVNNASAFFPTPIEESTQSHWNELFDSNVRAAYFLSQKLAGELKKNQGAIVNIVDTHADKPLLNHSIYNMAKAALKTMTKSLAKDFGPEIRVNGVAPGAILWSGVLAKDEDPDVEQGRQKLLESIPLKRLGKADEIAQMVYFLATTATYISGQVIKVDGGRSLS
jgi:pteridine reductase